MIVFFIFIRNKCLQETIAHFQSLVLCHDIFHRIIFWNNCNTAGDCVDSKIDTTNVPLYCEMAHVYVSVCVRACVRACVCVWRQKKTHWKSVGIIAASTLGSILGLK